MLHVPSPGASVLSSPPGLSSPQALPDVASSPGTLPSSPRDSWCFPRCLASYQPLHTYLMIRTNLYALKQILNCCINMLVTDLQFTYLSVHNGDLGVGLLCLRIRRLILGL